MNFDHIHFYVQDAKAQRHWFTKLLGFQAIASYSNRHTCTEVVKRDRLYFLISSPQTSASPVAHWLKWHPPGVADVAFRVPDLKSVLAKAMAKGANVLHPLEEYLQQQGCLLWAKIAGWGNISHSLVERQGITPLTPEGGDYLEIGKSTEGFKAIASLPFPPSLQETYSSTLLFNAIDHAVLNVEVGDLEKAVSWYQTVLGFQAQQRFEIQTDRSALRSRVLIHPEGEAKLPINEPASTHSQIQEFLEVNRGPGIQHIALQTTHIVQAVAELRSRGLAFLPVPSTYYTQLQQQARANLLDNWQALEAYQILADWPNQVAETVLLQIFTQPIFPEPTFFFELIERRSGRVNGQYLQAQGFGEGNFQALFEAMEMEQLKRGSLP